MKIPIDQIYIGERQRLDLGDLTDLDSMADPEVGQIVPIIVHRTPKSGGGYELVEGRRRIEKAKQLGWTELEAYDKGTLTPVQKQLMELFADIGRKDRSWQEKCIATAKVHGMLRREKMAKGEVWTTRAMSTFTGVNNKKIIEYMLRAAEALLVEPKDEEIWGADGYYFAVKILVDREFEKANKELERRRQIANATNLKKLEPDPVTHAVVNEGPGSERTSTEEWAVPASENEDNLPGVDVLPVTVYIHAKNRKLDPANENDGFASAGFVLAYEPDEFQIQTILGSLQPNAYAVLWFQYENYYEHFIGIEKAGFQVMPYPLVWNTMCPTIKDNWPFAATIRFGLVCCKEPKECYEPNSNVISCIEQEAGVLPPAVVEFSMLVPENNAVVLPCNANPVAVASIGRVPIWYEPDKNRYDEQVKALIAFYEDTIPGVQCKVQSE